MNLASHISVQNKALTFLLLLSIFNSVAYPASKNVNQFIENSRARSLDDLKRDLAKYDLVDLAIKSDEIALAARDRVNLRLFELLLSLAAEQPPKERIAFFSRIADSIIPSLGSDRGFSELPPDIYNIRQANYAHKFLGILLKNSPELAQRTDEFGQTLLHHASQAGLVQCVHVLLDNGANPYQTDIKNRSPFFFAISRGYPKIIDLFLRINPEHQHIGAKQELLFFFNDYDFDLVKFAKKSKITQTAIKKLENGIWEECCITKENRKLMLYKTLLKNSYYRSILNSDEKFFIGALILSPEIFHLAQNQNPSMASVDNMGNNVFHRLVLMAGDMPICANSIHRALNKIFLSHTTMSRLMAEKNNEGRTPEDLMRALYAPNATNVPKETCMVYYD